MHNIMTNRSKMLIRRASTREGLLKKQREQELQSIEALSETNFPQMNIASEVTTNKNIFKKTASANYVLQDITDNHCFSQNLHNGNGNESSRDSSDSEDSRHSQDSENCLSTDKNLLDDDQIMSVDPKKRQVTRPPCIGFTLGFSFTDSNDNTSQVKNANIPAESASKVYRRSRSCGVILSLHYKLNENEKINMARNNNNENDGKPVSNTLQNQVAKSDANRNNVHTFPRSRSLMLLASRGRYLVNGTSRAVDGHNVISEGDEKSVDKDEEMSEKEDSIGRFTKVFHQTEQEVQQDLEKCRKMVITDNADTAKQNSKNTKMPLIKQQLMPHKPKLDKAKENDQNSQNRIIRNIERQEKEFDKIDIKELEPLEESCLLAQPSSLRETCQVVNAYSKENSQMIKIRRQGSIEPPVLSTIIPSTKVEMKESKVNSKIKKYKKCLQAEEALFQEYSGQGDSRSRNPEKTGNQELTKKPSRFAGLCRSVLPPIRLGLRKDSTSNSRIGKSMTSPIAQTKPSSESSSRSFPDTAWTRRDRKGNSLALSDQSDSQLGSRNKRSHGSTDSEGSVAEEDDHTLIYPDQLTGCNVRATHTSSAVSIHAASSGYHSQILLSDTPAKPSTDTECDNSMDSPKGQNFNSDTISQNDAVRPAKTKLQKSNTAQSKSSDTVYDVPDSNDGTVTADKKSQGAQEMAAVSRLNPSRKPRRPAHQSQSYRLTGRCSALDIDTELSPELFSFLTSPCAGRRDAICAVIDDMQGRPLTTVSSLVVMEDMMV